MANDTLHNLNDLLAELEGISIKTSQGSFIKVEDARRLIDKRKQAQAIETATAPPAPKTLEQAREGAKKFLQDQRLAPPVIREPGSSIPAVESQSSSRT